MTKAHFALLFCLLLACHIAFGERPDPNSRFDAEASLVEIEVTKKSYDYRVPWNIRNTQIQKNGVIIEDGQILTTADGLSGQYLCRIRKGGISKQYDASVSWVDYYSNLAILTIEDEAFWSETQPVELIEDLPLAGEVSVYRWRSGRIESRAAEIIRLYIGTSKTSFVEHIQMSASSEIGSAGWSEIVISNGQLVGLTSSATKTTLNILPTTFIRSILEKRIDNKDFGVGYFDFSWMRAKNPALLESKGFAQTEHGVVITQVGKRRLSENALEFGDILFEIGGFKIDNEGKYLDPAYGRLSMNGLATRSHFAGDSIPMKIWRSGKAIAIDYLLPEPDFEKSLIPERNYDAAPAYYIAGGLVFQPLDGPFIRSLGKHRPILLEYYAEAVDLDRDGLVVLSTILPDDYNRGYESYRLLVVDEINSLPIATIQDVAEAFESSELDFHQIKLMPDSNLEHIVLDRTQLSEATEKILKHYHIPQAVSY